LPGILPGRRHIVLTRDRNWEAEEAEVAHDLESAIDLANAARIAVIGGAQIFAAALPRAQRIELTEIHRRYHGDTIMPAIDLAQWEETGREHHADDARHPAFSFVTLRRIVAAASSEPPGHPSSSSDLGG